jgi:hypothetical protein
MAAPQYNEAFYVSVSDSGWILINKCLASSLPLTLSRDNNNNKNGNTCATVHRRHTRGPA